MLLFNNLVCWILEQRLCTISKIKCLLKEPFQNSNLEQTYSNSNDHQQVVFPKDKILILITTIITNIMAFLQADCIQIMYTQIMYDEFCYMNKSRFPDRTWALIRTINVNVIWTGKSWNVDLLNNVLLKLNIVNSTRFVRNKLTSIVPNRTDFQLYRLVDTSTHWSYALRMYT